MESSYPPKFQQIFAPLILKFPQKSSSFGRVENVILLTAMEAHMTSFRQHTGKNVCHIPILVRHWLPRGQRLGLYLFPFILLSHKHLVLVTKQQAKQRSEYGQCFPRR